MARKAAKNRKRKTGKAAKDREALGLTLIALALLILGILLPQIPTGELLGGTRETVLGVVGVLIYAVPPPLLVLGSLFLVRREPPGWPRVLGGYTLLVLGSWTLLALLAPEHTGSLGASLNAILGGAAGVLGGAASVLVISFGIELILAWPLTTIVRVGTTRLIEFLRLSFRAALAARNRARARANFQADVVQERLKLRELDRDLEVLQKQYPGSSEVSKWRSAVNASREQLHRNPNDSDLEDARLDVAAWQNAVHSFTQERSAELGAALANEGLPGFNDWVQEVKAELEETFVEPVPPARALDDLRQALMLDLTALHERYRRLQRERDLAEPGLRDIRPRELPRAVAAHEKRLEELSQVREDARELDVAVKALEQWRELAADIFRSMSEYGSFSELHDYSTTLTQELREKGAEALGQLDGWFSALAAVRKRAWEEERRAQEERREAEERAVGERLRTLGAGPAPAPELEPTVVRYPRDLDGPVSYDAAAVLPRSSVKRPETTAVFGASEPQSDQEPFGQLPLDPLPPASEDDHGDPLPPAADHVDDPVPPYSSSQPVDQPELSGGQGARFEPELPEEDPLPPSSAAAPADDEVVGEDLAEERPEVAEPAPYQAEVIFDESGQPANRTKTTPLAGDEAESDIPEVGGIPIQVPPYSLLDAPEPASEPEAVLQQELQERVARIDETLSNFRLEGRVVSSVRGPTVTRFEVEPAPGEKISRFANLSDDLALAMAATSVRIEAPIPGKSVIGLEVPNAHRDLIRFREAAEATSFRRSRARLPLILGKSIDGELVVGDLARMPHLLIAGSTGSGKSVAINTLIGSLLYKFLPTELRFLMIDPKMVELTPYDGIPHLLRPVVTNPNDAAAVLLGAVSHMERRYKMMSKVGAKNLDQYNEKARNLDLPQLPFVVIIIDELADLMITSPKEVESAIMRLAQMARATGMHLVLATQRPSVDILTSLIKVNVPARIAFAVASGHDSRTILDSMGAERLVGMGDMLFYQPGLVKPVRLQGPFISETEIAALAGFLRRQFFEDEFVEAYGEDFDPPSLHESDADGYVDWNDEKLRVAAELVIQEGQASVSRLQRRLQVGHARAGKLMDSLEALGVVGPHTGSKPRDVLVDESELPNIFGR